MDILDLGLTGATLAVFISLLAVVSLMLGSAMQHTGNLLSGMTVYNNDPSDENRELLYEDINASDNYLRDISYVSSDALLRILDALDTDLLSGSEKESLDEARALLETREARELSDPDAIEISEKLGSILEKLETIG